MTSSTSSIDDLLDLDFSTPVATDDQNTTGVVQLAKRPETSNASNTLLLDFGAPTTESSTDDNTQQELTKDGDFCVFAMDDVSSQGSNTLTTGTSAVTPTSPWQPLDVVPGQIDLTLSQQSKSSVGFLHDEDALLFDPLAPTSHEPTQETSDSEPTLKKWTVTSGFDSDTVQPVDRPDLLEFHNKTPTYKKEEKMADPKQGKMNRTMERSFEDLLAGLDEDDLDPDLDDILTMGSLSPQITDASFNAMAAQSKKSYTQSEERLDKDKEEDSKQPEQAQKSEDQKTIDEIFGEVEETRADVADLLTSDEEEPHQDVEAILDDEPEANVDVMVTDHDEQDTQNLDQDEKEAALSDMDDSTTENGQLKREASLDFSDVGDTPHLDVNIGKQKTSLRKKGSLARRRKPTRTNVRNILSSSEDSHFQDTTESKESPSSEINGFGAEEDVFGGEKSGSPDPTSPPAKKSSHLKMPLPGLGQPMLPRKTPQPRASPDEEMSLAEPKRDPKTMGVKLPMPKLRPAKRSDKLEEKAVSSEFEKPALRKVTTPPETEKAVEKNDMFEVPALRAVAPVKPSRQSEEDTDTEKRFSKPPLKSVPKMEVDTTPVSITNETPYNIPLKRVDSNRERSPVKAAQESENIFDTPSLKRVQREEDSGRSKISPEKEGKFEVPALKTVPNETRRSESQEIESENTFNKPALRNTPKVKTEPPTSPEAKGKFDLPSLKRTPKVPRSDSSELNSGGAFDVPNLKNTPKRPVSTNLDFDDVTKVSTENKHKFDVPQLKNTPKSPKSEVEAGKVATSREDEPSWLKDMKLRKTSTKSEESLDQMKEVETPLWMKTAAEKREKAAEILNTKENQSKTPGDGKPQWTDMARLRKTPNGLPLQESTERSENALNGTPNQERVRLASSGSKDGDSSSSSSSRERTPVSGGAKDQYVPSWLKTKDSRHQSTPNLNVISPPSADSTSIPQWKKDLAERRKLRKENSVDTPLKAKSDSTDGGAVSWKTEFALKKKSTPLPKTTAEIRTSSSEPEWKKRADEKRQRLINSGLLDKVKRPDS